MPSASLSNVHRPSRLAILLGCWLLASSHVSGQNGWLRLYPTQSSVNRLLPDGAQGCYAIGSAVVPGDGRLWSVLQHLSPGGDTLWSRLLAPRSRATGLVAGSDGHLRVLIHGGGDPDQDSLWLFKYATNGQALGPAVFVSALPRLTTPPANELHQVAPGWLAVASRWPGEQARVLWLNEDGALRHTTDVPNVPVFYQAAADGNGHLALAVRLEGATQSDALLCLDTLGQSCWPALRFGADLQSTHAELIHVEQGWAAYFGNSNWGRLHWASATGIPTGTFQDTLVIGSLARLAEDTRSGGCYLISKPRLLPQPLSRLFAQHFTPNHVVDDTLSLTVPGYEQNTLLAYDLLPQSDGGWLTFGQIAPDPGGASLLSFVAKIDANKLIFNHLLLGKSFNGGLNCLANGNSAPGIPYTKFYLQKIGDAFGNLYLADEQGWVRRPADAGEYTVRALPPNPYWALCQPEMEVPVSGTPNDTTQFELPLRPVSDCPYLLLDLGTPALRCGLNTYFLRYCNTGTVAAEQAYLTLRLDPAMTLESSEKPIQFIENQQYKISLGHVAPGVCQTIRVTVRLDCPAADPFASARTHCVEAHIFPDTFCVAGGARLLAEGTCVGDSLVRFRVYNRGAGPTPGPVEFVVIEDIVIRTEGSSALPPYGKLQLAPGDFFEVTVPATGRTWALTLKNDWLRQPVVAVVADCGGDSPDPDLRLTFHDGDTQPSVAVDCRQLGTVDKMVSPAGLGPTHCIQAGQDLEYLLAFRNTGTEPVEQVVVRDTLSDLLDVESITPGASSHPYRLELTGNGRVLEWHFDSLHLTPTGWADGGSEAFVKFRVAQKPGLTDGDVIRNRAFIRLGDGPALLTETVENTVAQAGCFEKAEPPTDSRCLRIFPNPAHPDAPFTLLNTCGAAPGAVGGGRIRVSNALGQEVLTYSEQVLNGVSFRLKPPSLPPGCYFVRLFDSVGNWVATTRLVLL